MANATLKHGTHSTLLGAKCIDSRRRRLRESRNAVQRFTLLAKQYVKPAEYLHLTAKKTSHVEHSPIMVKQCCVFGCFKAENLYERQMGTTFHRYTWAVETVSVILNNKMTSASIAFRQYAYYVIRYALSGFRLMQRYALNGCTQFQSLAERRWL